MQNLLKHTIFKCFTIVIVLILLAPSLVKLGHVFENHAHEVCLDNSSTHLHTLDLECEFYKFKVNSNYTFFVEDYNFLDEVSWKTTIISHYTFLSKYQKLHFSQRGPPIYS